MSASVKGIYQHGTIKLLETPLGVKEGRVVVTVAQDDQPPPAPRHLQRGKYSKGKLSTEDDYRIAECREESGPS